MTPLTSSWKSKREQLCWTLMNPWNANFPGLPFLWPSHPSKPPRRHTTTKRKKTATVNSYKSAGTRSSYCTNAGSYFFNSHLHSLPESQRRRTNVPDLSKRVLQRDDVDNKRTMVVTANIVAAATTAHATPVRFNDENVYIASHNSPTLMSHNSCRVLHTSNCCLYCFEMKIKHFGLVLLQTGILHPIFPRPLLELCSDGSIKLYMEAAPTLTNRFLLLKLCFRYIKQAAVVTH